MHLAYLRDNRGVPDCTVVQSKYNTDHKGLAIVIQKMFAGMKTEALGVNCVGFLLVFTLFSLPVWYEAILLVLTIEIKENNMITICSHLVKKWPILYKSA